MSEDLELLDAQRLDALSERSFQQTKPFPWANPAGLLRGEAFGRLLETLPDVSLFTRSFGKPRSHGQAPHDRYALEYRDDLPVDPLWHRFVAELRGPTYQAFLRRMLGVRALWLSFHWHYTPASCSVSPHCDAARKLGSHIFYLNTRESWKEEWGGGTVVLDDGGRIHRSSAPGFDAFERAIEAQTFDNRSLLFQRTVHSWHGVREIHCPEGALRRVFIVVINRMRPRDRARQLLGVPLRAGY